MPDWVPDWAGDGPRPWLLAALPLALLALWGWRADHRRRTRREADAVGLLPWQAISFWASFGALLLMAGAVKAWRAG